MKRLYFRQAFRSRHRSRNALSLTVHRESSKLNLQASAPLGPKIGKFDYLSAPGHSAHSMASEFFTDDYFKHSAKRSAWLTDSPSSKTVMVRNFRIWNGYPLQTILR